MVSSSHSGLDRRQVSEKARPAGRKTNTDRQLAVLVAIATIGDPSLLELQLLVGQSRRTVQNILSELRNSNVVIQSNQTARRHSFRLIERGPYSLRRSTALIRQKHPKLMQLILAIKREHEIRTE